MEGQSGEVSVNLVLKAGKSGEELVARRRRARLIVRQVGSHGFIVGAIDADVRRFVDRSKIVTTKVVMLQTLLPTSCNEMKTEEGQKAKGDMYKKEVSSELIFLNFVCHMVAKRSFYFLLEVI